MDLITATPAEIDTEIARIEVQAADAYTRLKFTRQDIAQYDKAQSEGRSYFGRSIEILNDRRDQALADMAAAREARLPLDTEYIKRGGWTRYFVVDNNNGHLHTSTGCQNTYATTSWVWMTGMSGMTRAEAVEQGGSLTCLSCFPDFREEIESGREPRFETPRMRKTREEREAAAAKKAEKARKAAANAVYGEDGEPLQLPDYFGQMKVVKSEIAANRQVMEAATDLACYGADHPSAATWNKVIELGLPALARKRGTTVEQERAAVEAKVAKKLK
jgi:hypothetical protein